MPGFYAAGEYDVAGTIVGVVDRAKIVDGSRIAAGDVALGLPSIGLQTNGYTLARRVFFETMGKRPEDTPRRARRARRSATCCSMRTSRTARRWRRCSRPTSSTAWRT